MTPQRRPGARKGTWDRMHGRVMICPSCSGSACREVSPFFLANKGFCPKCNVLLVPDVDLARVAKRTLYVIKEIS